jgi:hypothetical protein
MQVAVLGTERAKDMRIEGKHAIDPAVSVVTVKVTGSRSPFTPAPVPVSPSHDTTGKRPVSTRFQLAAWSPGVFVTEISVSSLRPLYLHAAWALSR